MSSKKYFFNQKTSRQENIFLQNYVSSFLDGVLFEHLFLIIIIIIVIIVIVVVVVVVVIIY